jgi:hypothetical protein
MILKFLVPGTFMPLIVPARMSRFKLNCRGIGDQYTTSFLRAIVLWKLIPHS